MRSCVNSRYLRRESHASCVASTRVCTTKLTCSDVCRATGAEDGPALVFHGLIKKKLTEHYSLVTLAS